MGGSTRAAGPAMARQAVLAHTRNPGARGRRLAEENGVDAVFTGIVEELGEVVALEELADAARLTVRGPLVTAGAAAGDSIAVNGVCLTVTGASDGTFSADVMGETLSRSGLGALGAGSARPASTSGPPPCCSPRSPWTRWPAGAPRSPKRRGRSASPARSGPSGHLTGLARVRARNSRHGTLVPEVKRVLRGR